MGWVFEVLGNLLVDIFWTRWAKRWAKRGWFVVVLLNLSVLVLCWLLGGWYWAFAPAALALPWYVYTRFRAGRTSPDA